MEKPLTKNIDLQRGPLDCRNYEQAGGYAAVRKALTQMSPDEVTDVVKQANLRGRGGAGFPTGLKWSLTLSGDKAPSRKYLLCNADEMEPGTFKDRLLMEGDPHLLLEGMILAAYAIGADVGYIFLRDEYKLSGRRLQQAIAEAEDAGWLGEDILGSGYSLRIYLHASAGRYICGEETAMISALEGKRAIPRAKPPFPGQSGLFGKPTVVNNVETLCCVPSIVENGVDWFKDLALTESAGGTKLFGASGRVKTPGCWELPMGTPVRELLEEHAGGMRDGYKFKTLLPGGASTGFLVEEHLDLPMDFDAIGQAGSRMGTGTMIVVDDKANIAGVLKNLEHFFAQESCGWCTPCRDGLPWTEKLLGDIEAGRGRPGDIDLLARHAKFLGPGRTFCAHAPGAMAPLESALKLFRDELEAMIPRTHEVLEQSA